VTGFAADQQPGTDPQSRRIRRTWWFLAGSFFVLGLIVAVRFGAGGARPLDFVLLGLVAVVGCAAILHRDAVHALEVGRRSEAESFARILRALSRSVSPDAMVEAIVEELGRATGADHIVVVRQRAAGGALEATLVSSRPGVPSSTTLFPIADLEDPIRLRRRARPSLPVPIGQEELGFEPAPPALTIGDGSGGRVAARIAERVRAAYGLKHTLTAPLSTEDGVIGAIIVSRRTSDPWPDSVERLVTSAASEAAAALARATSHREAETLASTDALTGLPNRRYFDEFCALLAHRRRARDAVGVLMIDIDHFKSINDNHGHQTGDAVLRAVGQAVARAVREDDVPARYGGEEFAVLLRSPTPAVAVEVAERIRAAVAALSEGGLGVGPLSVSVGAAIASRRDQPIAEIVAEADRALYEAKRAGRDRVVAA
jgi:diguanylate cyclase (GGDEF)-like protein